MSISYTRPVERWRGAELHDLDGVASHRELARAGIPRSVTAAHIRARRWHRLGAAILLHNGPPTGQQRERAMLINCGPRSVLTSFTGAARWGLSGWGRAEIHVLAPAGTRNPNLPGLVLHRATEWSSAGIVTSRRLQRLAPALIVAASSFTAPRPACAILAAAVQQRLVPAATLQAALDQQPKVRHFRAMRLALHDIAQGSHALSEIDFVRLCRRHGLPVPVRQAVRIEPSGRHRFLDAEWRLPDGRVFTVEVDGALHLAALEWIADQLRQNEVVLEGTAMLRFPSILVRHEDDRVVAQLRRGLLPRVHQ